MPKPGAAAANSSTRLPRFCVRGGSNPVSGATSAPVSTTGFTSIRFVNGSPDANSNSGVDFDIDGTTVLSDFSYGAVTPYYDIPSGAGHTFGAYASGTVTTLLPGVSLATTGAQNYTFVLAGTFAKHTQQWIVYADPTYTSLITQFSFTVHLASPTAAAISNTFQFGTFVPPATTSTVYVDDSNATYPGAATGTVTPAVPNTPVVLSPLAASAPGIEFFTSPNTPKQGTTLPAQAVTLPSAIDTADTTNTVPNSSISPAFYHCSLFVIDSNATPNYEIVAAQD